MDHFFVDAETDGLYGTFLSIAAMVTDESGQEVERFYGAFLPPQDKINSKWVLEHVYPYLHNAEKKYTDETALLEDFWQFWMKHRENCICITDVGHPVESRLFSTCVKMNLVEREWLGPFPMLDLSTLLLAHGIQPLTDRKKLSGLSLKQHDAMNDACMMAKIWHFYQETQKHILPFYVEDNTEEQIGPQSFGEACRLAREKAGYSSPEKAIVKMNIKGISWSAAKLRRIEKNQNKEHAMEDAIKLAEFYKSPELLIFYCDHTCSYGKRIPVQTTKTGTMIYKLDRSLVELLEMREELFSILQDNVIRADELEALRSVKQALAHASNAAKDIFRWAEKQGIQIPEFTAPATKWVEPSEFATLYFRERKAHFSKREDAAEKLYIHSDKLAEIERGKEDPTRQEIERMENAFYAPELGAYFCNVQCPIRDSRHLPLEVRNLGTISARLLTSLHYLQDTQKRLQIVLADQKIASEEQCEFTQLMQRLQDIMYSADSLEIWLKKRNIIL